LARCRYPALKSLTGWPRITGSRPNQNSLEPDTIVWYYDRAEVWRAPSYAEAKRPMFLLLNLALGGGTYNNAAGDDYDWNLTPNPSDLKVAYVAVWASPNSPNY